MHGKQTVNVSSSNSDMYENVHIIVKYSLIFTTQTKHEVGNWKCIMCFEAHMERMSIFHFPQFDIVQMA